MNITVLFCLLLAHVVADFLFQWDKLVNLRFGNQLDERIKGNLVHTGIHFAVSFFMTLPWLSNDVFITVLWIALLHFLIDIKKSELSSTVRDSVWCFLGDQLVHLISIVFLWIVLLKGNIQNLLKLLMEYTVGQNFSGNKLVLISFLFLVGLWGVAYFIKAFNCWLRSRVDQKESNIDKDHENKSNDASQKGIVDGGFIIGLLERTFIILSICFGYPIAIIGFVLATKSIARFKKFENDSFVEYFIIGTLISFMSAIVVGKLILRILEGPI